ncbi:hypothetical protein, partial [Shigella sonnei]|uniref:hypothetical protein n=1 Tax=Shigella sonnei TaxID=624 RepID=UPI00092D425B
GNIPVKRALSPHPCGLPRPSGNVSAILTPPTPALLLCSGQKVRFDNRGWTKLLDTPAYQFYMEAVMH